MREVVRGHQTLAAVQQRVSNGDAAAVKTATAAQARDNLIHDAAGGSRADVILTQRNLRNKKY